MTLSLCVLCYFCVAVADEQAAACTAGKEEVLLGPRNFTSSVIWFEKRIDLPLPRLVVKSVREPLTDEDIGDFLQTMSDVLDIGMPFTVLWDARDSLVTFNNPSWQQIMLGKAFADEHAARIDSLVQAHAVILRNMFVRAFLRLSLKLTAPPQPIHVGESEDEALTFARGQRESRSWVKDTYAST